MNQEMQIDGHEVQMGDAVINGRKVIYYSIDGQMVGRKNAPTGKKLLAKQAESMVAKHKAKLHREKIGLLMQWSGISLEDIRAFANSSDYARIRLSHEETVG